MVTVTEQPTFQQHPVDPGNEFAIGMYPTSWIVSTARLPLSHPEVLDQVMVITYRVAAATLTLVFPRDVAERFHADLSRQLRGLSGLVASRDGRHR